MKVVDGWEEPYSLVQCCIFEVAKLSPLIVVSYCFFLPFWPFQMVVKS